MLSKNDCLAEAKIVFLQNVWYNSFISRKEMAQGHSWALSHVMNDLQGSWMVQIISHTPVYVWLLLAYLVRNGWKAREDYVISWKSLLIMPAVMFVWSMYSTVIRHGSITMIVWALSLTIGIWLGALTVRKLKLRFDKQRNLIAIAGNWTPMILSMTIFSLRYFLGVMYGMHPDLTGSHSTLAIECVATIISGMFTGRLLGYYQKSRIAPHVDLVT